jgi:hypothetical protein
MVSTLILWGLFTALPIGAFVLNGRNQRLSLPSADVGHKPLCSFSMESDDASISKRKKSSNFDRMKNMEVRLNQLERQAPETLFGFYEPHFKSFSVRPGIAKVDSIHVEHLPSSLLLYNLIDLF